MINKDFIERFEEALDKGYIKAYFQPLIRTISGKVCGAEALARWVDPVLGIIPPGEFIRLLEENRLIHKLDLAMLENVCRFYHRHGMDHFPCSVNLSRIDFEETDMFSAITGILKNMMFP